jgi:hypothetical protein
MGPLRLAVKLHGKARRNRDSGTLEDMKDAFKDVREAVTARDGNTCLACGIVSVRGGPGLDVHHRDGDHGNNDPANLVTLCPLCHATQHFWFLANESPLRGRFQVIYLPRLTQEELNRLAWTMAVAYGKCREGIKAKGDLKGEEEAVNALTLFQKQIRAVERMILDWGSIPDALPEDWSPGSGREDLRLLADPVALADVLVHLTKECPRKTRGTNAMWKEMDALLYGLRVCFSPTSEPLQRLAKPFMSMGAWNTAGDDWLGDWKTLSAAVMKRLRERPQRARISSSRIRAEKPPSQTKGVPGREGAK